MRGAGILTAHETKEVVGRFQYVTGNSPDLELWKKETKNEQIL